MIGRAATPLRSSSVRRVAGCVEDGRGAGCVPPVGRSNTLHVIVGHGLPTMFRNAVAAFRSVLPDAELLVVDNASPQAGLRAELSALARADPHLELALRDSNDSDDPRVGALYKAHRLAFAEARRRGLDYVHLVQADTQLLWWDTDLEAELTRVLARHPRCLNIHLLAISSDRSLVGDLVPHEGGDWTFPDYSVTDTGLFALGRWDSLGLEWSGTERDMAARASELGLEVVVSKWPSEVPVPWPAVVRGGRQRGREVRPSKPYLCRPLTPEDVARIKAAARPVSLEEVCVPWGWSCLSPMSVTDLNWYYLNFRRIALRRQGIRLGRPRWVTAGLDRRVDLLLAPHRPSLVALVVKPLPDLAAELARRAAGRGRRAAGRLRALR